MDDQQSERADVLPWDDEDDDTRPIGDRMAEPPPSVGGPARPERWQIVVRSFGELFVTCGVVLLLFVVYELYITDLLNKHEQTQLTQQLQQQWSKEPSLPAASTAHGTVAVGQAFAILHVPRLGADGERVIVEGTDQEQLAQGPGHYVGTAFPGEKGNLALAGHRVGKGSPFLDLDTLRPGDPIVVETQQAWFVYRVLGDPATGNFAADPSGIPGQEIVPPSDLDAISPTPDAAATAPATGAYLTLTTCNPRFSARTRLIIHAKLDGSGIRKVDQPKGPAALREH
ncbi:MAG TPA: class E sortase [Blastococcus sp.]|nr:class E sortase [Blastococcus sp.]